MFKLYGKNKVTKLLGEFETIERCGIEIQLYKQLEKLYWNTNEIEFVIEEVS